MANFEDLKTRSERLSSGPRIAELDRLAASIEHDLPAPNEGDFSAIGMLITDAVLDWDEDALDLTLSHLQRLSALAGRDPSGNAAKTEGRLLGLIDIAHWGMQRTLPGNLMGHVEPDSHSHRFLQQIEREPMASNSALGIELDVEESEVSRVGRRLIQAGLARKRRLGRTNQWLITPRGLQVLKVLDEGGANRPTREHRQIA